MQFKLVYVVSLVLRQHNCECVITLNTLFANNFALVFLEQNLAHTAT